MTTARCAAGRKVPYLLSVPGLLFLYLFFLVPLVTLLKISLSTKPDRAAAELRLHVGVEQLQHGVHRLREQLWRAFAYAAIATVLCMLIAYPIAYFIAFKAGKWRNLLLGLVMVPFFTSFLLRTIAWQSLFADSGPVLGVIDALQPRRRARRASASSTTAGS